MDRTVRIDIDGDVLEFELEQPGEMNEDEFYDRVINYVLCNIQINIL